MSHRLLVTSFVDLDDTLFSSVRRHESNDGLEPAALLESGEVISYSNAKQRFLREMLEQSGALIPVTARNLSAFRRVLLAFSGPAILSHGATILTDGSNVDRDWQNHLRNDLREARTEFVSLLERIETSSAFKDGVIRAWLVHDEDLPVYLVVKDNARDERRLQDIAQDMLGEWRATHEEFGFHNNGNNVAILGPGVRKENGVRYLIEVIKDKCPESIFIGVGDSVTDEPFMRLCDFSVLAKCTQLSKFLAESVDAQIIRDCGLREVGKGSV
jgi:hydroxymethylpyrimidine pyrophosphatase-like HAD family hydrolase